MLVTGFERTVALLVALSDSVTGKPALLLVEDDKSLRDMLLRALERAGFAVTTAVDGHDALEQFHKQPVELVVTDILLPELDGFELIRRLRQESPELAIVAISGIHDTPNFRKLALQSGAKAALTKPIDRGQLVDVLRTMVA